MTQIEAMTLEAELVDEDAARDIAKAVSSRQTIARRYVMWLRRRHPEATPAELIEMLEHHYGASISTAGAVIAAGAIAVEVGIAMIPGGGVAATGTKHVTKQAAKKVSKEVAHAAVKNAAKAAALDTARTGARRVAGRIPAGDQQLQFELTAIFGLAIADIHGMDLDQHQAHALVYGLSNGRVTQQQIATMAEDVADSTPDTALAMSHRIAAGRTDWSHWAVTLADTLPAGAAQSLVQTIQTGQLETVREGLTEKQQTTIEYGLGAVTGGVTRFLFGHEVIDAARLAFPAPPDEFPTKLAVPAKQMPDADDGDAEHNRAVTALQDAAKSTGSWITGAANSVGGGVATGAGAVGTGAANAAGAVTRPFRSVDLDGDGVPDEPRALTAAKGVGGSMASAADAVGDSLTRLFKSKKRG